MKIEFHQDPARFLMANPWFGGLAAHSRKLLLVEARRTALSKGQLFGEAAPNLGLCAVLSGSLRIEIALGSARHVLFEIAGPGAILTLPPGAGGGARPIRLRAAGKTVALGVDALALRALLTADPDLSEAVQALALTHLQHILVVAAGALNFAPRARVSSRVLSSADRRIDEKDFAHVTQGELAEMTGLSRKSVQGHLRALEALALVEVVYGGVRILDRLKLLSAADGP